MKKLIATTILATAIAVPSFAAEVGSAVSNAASATADKAAEGYNTVKGSVEEKMATSNEESAKAAIQSGDVKAAATDATDAAKHKLSAADAKAKAKAHKAAASKKMAKAKADINAGSSTETTPAN